MSSPLHKIIVATPIIAKGRRIVLSAPLEDSKESDSEGSWAEFKGIADTGGSSLPDEASLAVVDPRAQGVQSEVGGGPTGACSSLGVQK